MNIIEINENSMLIVLGKGEIGKYLPMTDFDISDRASRMALRDMISELTDGKDRGRRVRLDMLGKSEKEINIFCTFGENENT
ncbi:MAG: hypothetical protein IKB23_01155 [Clostridia bacterium]|nr:hypothetical protein [Clostridia bacterium]MBR3715888.1 hypothetical protein [Clostridia bacterium]